MKIVKMENSVAERIRKLRMHYKLSVDYFAEGCKLSNVTVFNLERGEKISKKSVAKIVRFYGTSSEWLLFGKGKMLPGGKKEIHYKNIEKEIVWKEKTFLEMERKGDLMEKEIEKLWQMIDLLVHQKRATA
jgi:transcriptional regulator with XRE-family HTH domain